MKANKKKIIVLVSMIALLVATGCLNYFLNVRKADVDQPVDQTTPTFFATYRNDREVTRQQEIAYLDEMIASETSSAETIAEAEAQKLAICQAMETELVLEGLIKASSFNLGRMLYGDGSGKLATVTTKDSSSVTLDSVKNVIEGMVVDFYTAEGSIVSGLKGVRIVNVDRVNKKVTFGSSVSLTNVAANQILYVQGSKDEEITGLGKIFSTTGSLYEVDRTIHPWMNPYVQSEAGELSDTTIQTAIDFLEEVSGSAIDFITCSAQVKRAYQQYLGSYRRNIDVMELQGGYKALTYNGIPLVSDRFVDDDTMYLLNTKEFALHQLCDWKWLEGDDGKIIKQKEGYPTYSATLVKYADLICNKPNGQAKITGISSTISNPFKPIVNVTVDNTGSVTE